MALSEELLDILVCPQCKGALDYREPEGELVCKVCGLVYRVENDVPILLIDEAQQLDRPDGG